MAEELTPTAVSAWTSRSGLACWTVAYQRPDGTMHDHVFPQSTLEWRMAEYGLDSVDEALDIVLHEPWALSPMDPLTARDDPALRAGMVVRLAGPHLDYEPIRLHNADTVSDARDAHRIRIADAKTRVKITVPKGKTNPLDMILERHGVTADGVRAKAALVDLVRRQYRGEALPPQQPAGPFAADPPRALEASRA